MSDLHPDKPEREPQSLADPRQPFHKVNGSLIPQCEEHRWEYVRSADGGDYYRCINAFCGETTHQLLDGSGGG